jgi:hypothetical protein
MKRTILACALAMSAWGCQIVGGISGDLTLADAVEPGETGLPSREPFVWDAANPWPDADFVYKLPEWMQFLSYSNDTTSQVGALIRVGYQANEARVRDVGNGPGLLLEPKRTNYVANSSWFGAGWTEGSAPNGSMAAYPGTPGPGTELTATTFDAPLGNMQSYVAQAGGTVASSWLRANSASEPAAYFAYGSAFVPVSGEFSWRRYDVVRAAGDQDNRLRIETQALGSEGPIEGAMDITAFGAQVEDGLHPSSFIPTNGAPVLREPDRLLMDTKTVAPNGYFDVTMRFAPHYSEANQGVDHDLIAIEDDVVFVRMRPQGILVMYVGALQDDVKIAGITWVPNQVLEVRARYLPNKREITLSGATSGNRTVTVEGPVPPISVDPIVWVMGTNDGPQACVDLKYLEVR